MLIVQGRCGDVVHRFQRAAAQPSAAQAGDDDHDRKQAHTAAGAEARECARTLAMGAPTSRSKHCRPDGELALRHAKIGSARAAIRGIVELETVGAAEIDVAGRRQRLAEFLQFVAATEPHPLALRRFGAEVLFKAAGAPGKILVESPISGWRKDKPDQAAEQAKARRQRSARTTAVRRTRMELCACSYGSRIM